MFFFQQFQQNSSGNRKRIRQLRAPSLLDSGGLVSLLLLPAPRQAGRACSALCVLLSYRVLVAVRFGLWTMMAERCFSIDFQVNFSTAAALVLFSSNFSNSSSVIASYFVFFSAISAKQQRKPQAHTTAAGTVAARQRRLGVPTTPAGATPSR